MRCISSSASNAVAVSAYSPGSITLCADKNVTIEGSALVVNGVDVLMTTSNLEAELFNTKGELAAKLLKTTSELADLNAKLLNTTSELADLKAKVAALTALNHPLTRNGA
jgi:hypothetical protein